MTRYVLCALGVFFIGLSLFALGHPNSLLSSFMNFSSAASLIRIAVGLVAVTYGLLDITRQFIVRALVAVMALVALGAALLSLTTVYVLAIDTFCLVAGGLFGLVASLELTTSHPVHVRLPRVSLPSAPSLPQFHLRHIALRGGRSTA